jgi:hypothetical protein
MARKAPPGPGTIRASEIGTFLFCERAWWYERQGVAPSDVASQNDGLAWHRRHGRAVLIAGLLRLAGWALVVGALVAMVAYLALQAIG